MTDQPIETRPKRTPGPDQIVTWTHRLQYIAFRFFKALVWLSPLWLMRALGSVFGWCYWAFDKRHRQVALINLDLVFGQAKPEDEKQQEVKKAFIHFGQALMETLWFQRLNTKNHMKYVVIEGMNGFYEALEHGKGLLLCSAHYGNWELLANTLGLLKIPLSVMARPIDNPLVHVEVEKLRTQSGNRVIYKHKSARKVIGDLKENRVVGVVNDQDVHDQNRIFCDFFGHQATATPLPATLAYKFGTPLICGFSEPIGKGRYLLRFSPLIWPDPTSPQEQEIQRITLQLNRELEQQIQKSPTYWLWMHKRFKTTPEGPNPIYQQTRKVE